MNPLRTLLPWLLLLLALPSVAFAGSVYLNGVNIDGVTGQKFEGATVRIDPQGNVFIDAPGYVAKVVQPGQPPVPSSAGPGTGASGQIAPQGPPPMIPNPPVGAPVRTPAPQASSGAMGPPPGSGQLAGPALPLPSGPLSQHYFLVTEQTARGMTDYDVDVYVNGRWVRKLYSNEEQILTEITKFMVPGRNIVSLAAKKLHGGTRKSFSAEHVFRVIIGTGNAGGDNVMIDTPVVRFVRSAAEDRDITEEFPVFAR